MDEEESETAEKVKMGEKRDTFGWVEPGLLTGLESGESGHRGNQRVRNGQ